MKPSLHSLDDQTVVLLAETVEPKRDCADWIVLLKAWVTKRVGSLFESQELRVWQTVDEQGIVCWHADDPRYQLGVRDLSEDAMRQWIEHR